jgi:hypothetical protein
MYMYVYIWHYNIIYINCISKGVGHFFAQGLIDFFYSTTFYGTLKGIFLLLKYLTVNGKKKTD